MILVSYHNTMAFRSLSCATNECQLRLWWLAKISWICLVMFVDRTKQIKYDGFNLGTSEDDLVGSIRYQSAMQNIRPKFRVVEANSNDNLDNNGQAQTLALQIMIMNSGENSNETISTNRNASQEEDSSYRRNYTTLNLAQRFYLPVRRQSMSWKRPYDQIPLNPLSNTVKRYQSYDKNEEPPADTRHFYSLESPSSLLPATRSPQANFETTASTQPSTPSTTSSFTSNEETSNDNNPLVTRIRIRTPPSEHRLKHKIYSNPRSELIRTQHRPPWLRNKQDQYRSHQQIASILGREQAKNNVFVSAGKRYKFRVTTIAPSLVTTEFFKLISSAHSPIRLTIESAKKKLPQYFSAALNDSLSTTTTTTSDAVTSSSRMSSEHSDHSYVRPNLTTSTTSFHQPDFYGPSSLIVPTPTPPMRLATTAPTMLSPTTKNDGRVMSPAIMVKDDDYEFLGENGTETGYTRRPGELAEIDKMRGGGGGGNQPFRQLINVTISHGANSKPVTIIKHASSQTYNKRFKPLRISTRPTTTSSTTQSPVVLAIPERLSIDDNIASTLFSPQTFSPSRRPTTSSTTTATTTTTTTSTTTTSTTQPPVRLISKQKHKYDENVTSSALTVVDNDAIRLPPRATSVHNNKLIVAIRPGRPVHRHPTTTAFPVYNIVAGITPPYPAQMQYTRPPVNSGQVYGFMKPPAGYTTTPAPSTFGAQNIKFPAPPPSQAATGVLLDPGESPPPDKVSLGVPETANMVGPVGQTVPDRLVMNSSQADAMDASQPPSSFVVSSNATIVSRPPYGSNTTFIQDGIIRLTTTRRPNYSTTKRINIVSANTTVITTNPDQLSDVINGAIVGSHTQNSHFVHQRPPEPRPSLLATVAKLFNASVTTSVIAILSLIKTVFIAILVMFLPPIALTAAIIQAVG